MDLYDPLVSLFSEKHFYRLFLEALCCAVVLVLVLVLVFVVILVIDGSLVHVGRL